MPLSPLVLALPSVVAPRQNKLFRYTHAWMRAHARMRACVAVAWFVAPIQRGPPRSTHVNERSAPLPSLMC